MSDKFLSEKIKKILPSNVSADRYSYFKPGEVEPDLGVPLIDNAISASLIDGTRKWLYTSSGLDIANNTLSVDINTIEVSNTSLNYAAANTLFNVIDEIDQNAYNDIQRRLIIVSTDSTLLGDGTANNVLSVNSNNIVDIISQSVTQEFVNNLNVDAGSLNGANADFYIDWNNTTNKPSLNVDIVLTGDVIGTANTTFVELQSGIITIDTTVTANSVELGVDTYGDYVQSISVGTGVYISNTYGESAIPTISIGQDVATTANVIFGNGEFSGDLTIGGNLTISGNVVSIDVTTLNIKDNLIYLNANNTVANPDLGWVGNYNEGIYAHTGMFRDATDGIFKFFQGYTPEPNDSPYINTGDASFALAPVQSSMFYGPLTGNVTGQVSSISNFSTSDLIEGSRLYYTTARVNTAIDTRVTKSFIDNLNVDADTFDGQDSIYYLNYNNLTNKPIIGDGLLTITGSEGLTGSGTFTANQVAPTNVSLTNTDRGSSQSIFKTILVAGQPTIIADNNTDILEFVAGANVSLSTNASNNQIIINSTAASEDNYVDSVSFNADTGTLTLGRTGTLSDLNVTIAALSANSSLTVTYSLDGDTAVGGAAINLLGSDSTTDAIYAKGSGATTVTWGELDQTITIHSVDTTYQAGAGLDLVGTTFSHEDTSTVSNLSVTNNTYISGMSFDTYGHVTGYSTGTVTDNYVDSVAFNSNTSILTLGRTGLLSDLEVELAGLQSVEVDTLESVVARGNTTANTIYVGSLVSTGDVYAPTFIGNLTGQVSDISNFDTDDLAEGATKLYFSTARANTAIDARVTKTFIDNLDVDAATLGGALPSFYLNYNNLTNKPDSILDFGIIDGANGQVLTTDGAGNFAFDWITLSNDQLEIIAQNITVAANTTPIGQFQSQLWFDTENATLSVFWNDGDSDQWVTVSGPSGPSGPQGIQGDAGTILSYVANSEPVVANTDNSGTIWFDTSTNNLKVLFANNWITTSGPQGPQGPSGETGILTETSSTPPVNPIDGQMWFDTTDGTLNVYYDDGDSNQWVTVSGPQGIQGATGADGMNGTDGIDGTNGTVSIVSNTAPVSNTAGSMWFDVSDSTLNVYTGYEWVVTSGPQGPQGPQGPDGIQGIQGIEGPQGPTGDNGVDGTLAAVANTAPVSNTVGEIWFDVSDSTLNVYTGYEWVVTSGPQGAQGPQGSQGVPGNNGLSAYQIAVSNGFIGTETEWLQSLIGPQGSTGGLASQAIAMAIIFSGY